MSQMNLANLAYTEELYKLYKVNPNQVDESWRWFFQGLEFAQNDQKISSQDLTRELKALEIVRLYREKGCLKASLHGFESPKTPVYMQEEFEKKEGETHFHSLENLLGKKSNFKEICTNLRQAYCESIGLQTEACSDEVKSWLFKEMEAPHPLSEEQEKQALLQVVQAESLEHFLQFHFMGKKRFSLEGLEACIAMMEFLLQQSPQNNIKEWVIGMAHRGRLNMLINFMKQDPKVIFSEFKERSIYNTSENWTGDVKYHLGFSSERKIASETCRLHLAYNPSHLEAINSCALGITRALQRAQKDTKERKRVLPILLHGDAAFIGQGSVSETLQLSQLKGYTVGGTLHIILNNQLGFTTRPEEGRTSLYSSDLAKSIQAPALLVNADCLPSCLKAAQIAIKFRQTFGQDIFIDLIGYRRYGHNEGDEPSFTHPQMYKKIRKHPSLSVIYQNDLADRGLISKKEVSNAKTQFELSYEKSLKETKVDKEEWHGIKMYKPKVSLLDSTQVSAEIIKKSFDVLSRQPQNFHLHPKVKKMLNKRKDAIKKNSIDWALAELCAYHTLLQQGFSIRLTGQDSKRGTFSHRHSVYYDTETEQELVPLKTELPPEQECCLYNSPLSEMACLGFEYGNSCMAPDFLTVWEAQFGDFANGAQIIIDNFICSGEQKWLQTTDITLLLPHGYEGQGPEHSSARLERFLQLCAENNIQVCCPTTPANMFHVLRRQKTLKNRKPLVIMTPKSLLRHEKVKSSVEDFCNKSFQKILAHSNHQDLRDIQTLILCSGKIYYDVLEKNQSLNSSVALYSLEQLYPFPKAEINSLLNNMSSLKRVVWLQEEPRNQGAWSFVSQELENLLKALGLDKNIQYIGRASRAASSEGSFSHHVQEQQRLVEKALALY